MIFLCKVLGANFFGIRPYRTFVNPVTAVSFQPISFNALKRTAMLPVLNPIKNSMSIQQKHQTTFGLQPFNKQKEVEFDYFKAGEQYESTFKFCLITFNPAFLLEDNITPPLKENIFFIFTYLMNFTDTSTITKLILQKVSIQKIAEIIGIYLVNKCYNDGKMVAVALKVISKQFLYLFYDKKNITPEEVKLKNILTAERVAKPVDNANLYQLGYVLDIIIIFTKLKESKSDNGNITFDDIVSIIFNENLMNLYIIEKRTLEEFRKDFIAECQTFDFIYRIFLVRNSIVNQAWSNINIMEY